MHREISDVKRSDLCVHVPNYSYMYGSLSVCSASVCLLCCSCQLPTLFLFLYFSSFCFVHSYLFMAGTAWGSLPILLNPDREMWEEGRAREEDLKMTRWVTLIEFFHISSIMLVFWGAASCFSPALLQLNGSDVIMRCEVSGCKQGTRSSWIIPNKSKAYRIRKNIINIAVKPQLGHNSKRLCCNRECNWLGISVLTAWWPITLVISDWMLGCECERKIGVPLIQYCWNYRAT